MRQEVYRVAYDEAHAELSEILAKFEQLRQRKDRIEKVVEALKPLLGESEPQLPEIERAAPAAERPVVAEPPLAHAAPAEPAIAPAAYAQPEEPVTTDTLHDPFSRRVENGVGLGAGNRDVREYSRLFNSSLNRGN